MKVTKLSDYQSGVQPVDYHKFYEEQWLNEFKRGERIAKVVMWTCALMIVSASGLGLWVLLFR